MHATKWSNTATTHLHMTTFKIMKSKQRVRKQTSQMRVCNISANARARMCVCACARVRALPVRACVRTLERALHVRACVRASLRVHVNSRASVCVCVCEPHACECASVSSYACLCPCLHEHVRVSLPSRLCYATNRAHMSVGAGARGVRACKHVQMCMCILIPCHAVLAIVL